MSPTSVVDANVVHFPPGIPPPHQLRKWARYIEGRLPELDLVELAQNTLPLGKFDPIYPDTMFEEIRLPRDASTSERLSHRRWAESQTKMRLHNDKVKAARDAWWSNALNLYFELRRSRHEAPCEAKPWCPLRKPWAGQHAARMRRSAPADELNWMTEAVDWLHARPSWRVRQRAL